MEKLTQIINGQVTVSTLTVAKYTNNQHLTITRIIRNNVSDFKEFGKLGFEIQAIKNSKNKINEIRYYNLNEQQYSLLMTYLRNNPKVKEFKKNMVKAFFTMRNKIKHDGKNYKCVINGYKSQIKQLQNKLKTLPSSNLNEKELLKEIEKYKKAYEKEWIKKYQAEKKLAALRNTVDKYILISNELLLVRNRN